MEITKRALVRDDEFEEKRLSGRGLKSKYPNLEEEL